MMIDGDAIQALLAARGKSGTNLVDYSLHDHGDGNGVVIGKWDEAKLGPRPTPAEIDALPAPRVKGKRDRIDSMLSAHGLTIEDLKAELSK